MQLEKVHFRGDIYFTSNPNTEDHPKLEANLDNTVSSRVVTEQDLFICRYMSGVFLSHFFPCLLIIRLNILQNTELTALSGQPRHELQGSTFVCHLSNTKLYPPFSVCSWELNPGPCVCTASAVLTEMSCEPLESNLLYMFISGIQSFG